MRENAAIRQQRMIMNNRRKYIVMCREIRSKISSEMGMNEWANIVREGEEGTTDYQTTIQKMEAHEAKYCVNHDYNFDKMVF